ncbi:MAG: tetratricopeptide repeat protein [Desulfovibrionaceae bacterium]
MADKPEKNIDLDRRNFLFGAFRRRSAEDAAEPAPAQAATDAAFPVLKEANEAFAAGDWERACEKYREALKAESGNTEARMRLGRAFYRQGKFIQAKVEFERVLHDRKKDNEASLHLGLVLARLDRADKAAVVWRQYFDPEATLVQREINVQLAFLEDEAERPTGAQMADAVEAALERQKAQAGATA